MIGERTLTLENKRVSRRRILGTGLLFVVLLIAVGLPLRGEIASRLSLAPETPGGTLRIRALWVQYSAASTPEKANQMLDQAAQAGFNTVLYNVGCGAVVYPSAILPRATKIPASFDPLKYVVEQGHARGLKVQAWWCPGYSEEDTPFRQLHPDWDIASVPGAPAGTHWLDFSRPEARKFVGDVVMEIASKYDVDGIQLDYIRYPAPLDTNGHHFSQSDVPNTVRAAYQRLKAFKPQVLLTAAVMDSGYRSNRYMQHWEEWLKGNYIDYVMPMAYFAPEENNGLGQDLIEWARVAHPERIVPGLAIEYSSNQGKSPAKSGIQLVDQLRIISKANATGYAIFDHEALSGNLVTELYQYGSMRPPN